MVEFRPAGEEPEQHHKCKTFLLYSSCSGYSLAKASFDSDGKFDAFLTSSAGEVVPLLQDDFDLWLILESRPCQVRNR